MPPTPSTVTSLYDLAEEVLGVAVTCLATTAAGVPDLAYVAPASPVFDCCPALIVAVPQLGEESTSPSLNAMDSGQKSRFGRVNLATLNVIALRCDAQMKSDGSITTAQVQDAAREVLEDGWALWCGFYHAIIQGTFEGKCSDVHFDIGRSITEQGGCVGWTFVFRALLEGIPVPEGT